MEVTATENPSKYLKLPVWYCDIFRVAKLLARGRNRCFVPAYNFILLKLIEKCV